MVCPYAPFAPPNASAHSCGRLAIDLHRTSPNNNWAAVGGAITKPLGLNPNASTHSRSGRRPLNDL
eukprot:1539067-Lingulodinium_polyedra.AAC.1